MGCFIGRLCAGNFQLSIVKNNKNQGGCKKMSYQETYKKWCTDPYFDAQTQEELKNLEGTKKRSRTVSTVSWSLEPADSVE